MYEEWLRTLSEAELRALQQVADREIARYREEARPAEQPGRVGRGGIYLKVDD